MKITLLLILFSRVCSCLFNDSLKDNLREPDTPATDATVFSAIVQTVIDTIPFSCADYVENCVEYNGATLPDGDYDALYWQVNVPQQRSRILLSNL
ncbi:MAG: hypothetical protein KAW93_10965 [Methanogenium sp.]|nr:hypothetical protein [Methanogenium sp.]